jgi:hypothetical protein
MRQGASGFLLMYSKFTPTCFGKWLSSTGGRRYLRGCSSNIRPIRDLNMACYRRPDRSSDVHEIRYKVFLFVFFNKTLSLKPEHRDNRFSDNQTVIEEVQ